ncbi:MAG: hypothetical protein ACJ8C4_16810 [Gemmataceae bacterium]
MGDFPNRESSANGRYYISHCVAAVLSICIGMGICAGADAAYRERVGITVPDILMFLAAGGVTGLAIGLFIGGFIGVVLRFTKGFPTEPQPFSMKWILIIGSLIGFILVLGVMMMRIDVDRSTSRRAENYFGLVLTLVILYCGFTILIAPFIIRSVGQTYHPFSLPPTSVWKIVARNLILGCIAGVPFLLFAEIVALPMLHRWGPW